MKLLISGICGFAGSVLAKSLMEMLPGLKIVGFDNLSRRGSETNLEPLRGLGLEVHVGDLRDRTFLAGLPACDWVLDCAANPSVLAGIDGSSSTRDLVDANLYGTVNLLELCKSWKAGFVLLSTSRVYSIPPLATLALKETPSRYEPQEPIQTEGISRHGVRETFSTTPPVSLYGSTKICSELLALEYGEAFGFPVLINRCGVLAGAGQFGKADQGIFSYWIHSWAAKKPLRYIGFGGSGKQVRDCLHPRDLAPLLQKQFRSPSGSPKVCNVAGGSQNSLSLLELSRWCETRFGPLPSDCDPSAISSTDSIRPFDIPWMVLDSSLAESTWGWLPETKIHQVLEEIAEHAEQHPDWLDVVAQD